LAVFIQNPGINIMRIQHRYLSFEKSERLLKTLDHLSIQYKVEERSFDEQTRLYVLEFFLYEDNPRFGTMKEALFGFDIEARIGTLYDKEDIAKANWFYVMVGEFQYPQPEDDFGYLRATFNLDHYCPNCGIGKSQNAPFRLKTIPKQPNSQFWGLHWEHDAIFIRAEAKRILESENIEGISFSKPVLHKNGLEVADMWQMHIHTELSAGLDSYNLQTETCEYADGEENEEGMAGMPVKLIHYCSRIKYNFPNRGPVTFDESCFQNAPEIVRSNEWFGSGGVAFHLPLVSKRLKQIIEKNKLKGLAFTPVFHRRFE
jgi:hypothetical protein